MNHSQNTYLYFERLDVWRVSLEMVRLAQLVADGVPGKSGELSDQLRRSSQSVVANLAEGMGKVGKDRLRYNRVALGSAYETGAHLGIALTLGFVQPSAHDELHALIVRVVSMLTRMTR